MPAERLICIDEVVVEIVAAQATEGLEPLILIQQGILSSNHI